MKIHLSKWKQDLQKFYAVSSVEMIDSTMATLRAGILLDNARLLLAFLLASSIVGKLAALNEMKQKCMAVKWH